MFSNDLTASKRCMGPMICSIIFFSILLFCSSGFLETLETSKSYEEEVRNLILTKSLHHQAPRVQDRFKNIVTPVAGTVQLTKGSVRQVHHDIKEDSVIVVSRKSLNGKAGMHLLVSVVPNEYFTITSVDSEGLVEEEDCGEISFIVR